MPVDKVKPLKFEDASSGSEMDFLPTETDPTEDYISAKGLAFENTDTFLGEKIGGICQFKIPDGSWAYVYHVSGPNNGSLDYAEYFEGLTQTVGFRRMRIDFVYTAGDMTSEAWKIYDPANGTTVLRTVTFTHTYTSSDLTKTEQVTT